MDANRKHKDDKVKQVKTCPMTSDRNMGNTSLSDSLIIRNVTSSDSLVLRNTPTSATSQMRNIAPSDPLTTSSSDYLGNTPSDDSLLRTTQSSDSLQMTRQSSDSLLRTPQSGDSLVVRIAPGVMYERNSPLPSGKRDSGYVTDNSPATFSPYPPHFTFDLSPQEEHLGAIGGVFPDSDSQDLERDVLEDFAGVYLDDDEEGDDSPFLDEVDGISDGDADTAEPTGPLNRVIIQRQVSQPLAVPLSPPIADIALRNGVPTPFRLPARFSVSSVSTQTPHVLSQMVQHVLSEPFIRSRGTVVRRLRHSSESDDVSANVLPHAHGPLPDLVPHPRDRSISLPDMQALRTQRELEVGRELRRLSDEFNLNYCSRRQRARIEVNMMPSNSFPGARRSPFTSFMDVFRSIFLRSPSPLDEDEQDDDLNPS